MIVTGMHLLFPGFIHLIIKLNVVIISHYICMSSYCVVYLTLIQYYMPIKLRGKEIKNATKEKKN